MGRSKKRSKKQSVSKIKLGKGFVSSSKWDFEELVNKYQTDQQRGGI